MVVGAGMAGLVAARILEETGFSVKVLEARDRLGGRIWTDTSLGYPCDLGASWIHGARGNPLTRWCRSLGIPTVKHPRGYIYFYQNGKATPFAKLLWRARSPLLRAILRIVKSLFKSRLSQASIALSFNPHGSKGRGDSFIWWLMAMVEGINGARAERLQLRELDPLEYFRDNLVLVGGFSQLVEDAAAGLDVLTGHQVKALSWHGRGVMVKTNRGNLEADIALITLPLGVLRAGAVKFHPPLPRAKVTAIERLGEQGVLNKVVLRLEQRYWPPKHQRLAHLPPDPETRGALTYWIDLDKDLASPLLVGFASGEWAERMDLEMEDQEVVAHATKVIETMFGQRLGLGPPFLITRWLSDPWARGAYSFGVVGATEDDRRTLSQPVQGKLFFAGESTEPEHYGTVHGALLSGEREAVRIHKLFKGYSPDLKRFPWH